MTEHNCELIPVNSKVVLEIDAFPFKGLKISEDWKQLDSVQDRTLCFSCKKSRKYFCYTCHIPVPELQHIVPKIKLPIKIDVIKHAREIDGKSTAIHAAVLAPDDVRIFTYPCIPDYDPQENVVLIFPNKEAVSVEDVCEQYFRNVREPASKRQCREDYRFVVHRAVFIDSTWNQSRGIFKDPRIKGLPSVVLKSRLSQFWRHQADSPRWYLATIEAIHQFLVELDAAQWRLNCRTAISDKTQDKPSETTSETDKQINKASNTLKVFDLEKNICNTQEIVSDKDANVTSDSDIKRNSNNDLVFEHQEYCYNGQYDNLLFFFRFMYSKIHELYDHEQLKSYKRRLE